MRELRIPKDQACGRVEARDLRAGERFEGVMIAPLRSFDQVSLVHDRLWLDAGICRVSDGMASPSSKSFPDMETRRPVGRRGPRLETIAYWNVNDWTIGIAWLTSSSNDPASYESMMTATVWPPPRSSRRSRSRSGPASVAVQVLSVPGG